MIPSTEQKILFQHYLSDTWSYDELQGEDGKLRPHWQTFFQSFSELGRDEILNRNQDVLRFLKENGVTYNIYGDPAGQNRPWNLDLIPFLISTQEWQIIESGLKQRAELFNHILKDIYGERRLIKNGLLPIIVDAPTHQKLLAMIAENPATELTIDLAAQTLSFPGGSVAFPIDPFNKTCLLNGVDELGYILSFEKEIAVFEARR